MSTKKLARFTRRTSCITCGSTDLIELSSGRFHDLPLRTFLENDAWAEQPLPYLEEASWSFVACSHCGQKFHRNILDDEWIGVYYNNWMSADAIEEFYRRKGTRFNHEFTKGKHAAERMLAIEHLTRCLRGPAPVKLLDFGCGEGEFINVCADFGFDCVGVEFSTARRNAKRIEFFESLGEVAAKRGLGQFDAATLFEVLEHLARPLGVLRELNPHLKQGGILVLETPNCQNTSGITTEMDYRLIHPLGHINAFTPTTQARIAKEAGFSRIRMPVTQFSTEPARVFKREIRRALGLFMPRSTQQVFIKTSELRPA